MDSLSLSTSVNPSIYTTTSTSPPKKKIKKIKKISIYRLLAEDTLAFALKASHATLHEGKCAEAIAKKSASAFSVQVSLSLSQCLRFFLR